MNDIKNIIFDLNGVLFEYYSVFPNKIFKPINAGINILKICHQYVISKNKKLYVCTNFSEEILTKLRGDFPEIFNLFDGYVNTTMSGAKKPDLKMFQFMCEFYKIIPEESLFIDDQLLNVLSAAQFGMQVIHVDDWEKVNQELKKILIYEHYK